VIDGQANFIDIFVEFFKIPDIKKYISFLKKQKVLKHRRIVL